MSAPQKNPLRPLTVVEQQQLERLVKASSERLDVIRRAKALLALMQGHTFTEAGKQAGISRQAVAQLVERFHQRGMAAVLTIAPGRGRKLTYDQEVRAHILRTVGRCPDRQVDGTVTWSLKTLERTLRRETGAVYVVCSYHPSGAVRSRLHLPTESYVVSNRNRVSSCLLKLNDLSLRNGKPGSGPTRVLRTFHLYA